MQIVKLYPECKDNIWGGTLLRDKYGKQTDKEIVAESWDLSFHKDGPTRLADGKTLQETATVLQMKQRFFLWAPTATIWTSLH